MKPLAFALLCLLPAQEVPRKTDVSIRGEQVLINGRPTYEGRSRAGKRIEGGLANPDGP